jgi:hypothetical protein
MQIRFNCPTDKCVALIEYEPLEGCGPTMQCPRCKKSHSMNIGTSIRDRNMVEQCAVCGGRELFIRKDFPQRLGAAIVIVFGLAAIYAFTFNVLIGWSILASAVVLDLLIYFVIGKVTACYACRAEYRKCLLNPAHEGFDLATSEKY